VETNLSLSLLPSILMFSTNVEPIFKTLAQLGLILLLTPTFVHAGLFPKDSLVKMIDAKEFKEVMKLNVRVLCPLQI
jgi:hypothetical protein